MNRLARLLGLALTLLLLFLGALALTQHWLRGHTERIRVETIAAKEAQFDRLLALANAGPPPWSDDTIQSLSTALGATITETPSASSAPKASRWEFIREFNIAENSPATRVVVRFTPPAVVHLVSLYQQTTVLLLFLALGLTLALVVAILFSLRSRNVASLETSSVHAEMRSLTHLAQVSARQGTELERERNERLRAEEDAHFQQTLLNRALEEKIRLGHDLHDGIIQSLYASGLTVEAAKNLIATDPTAATKQLEAGVATINATIREVRGYIAGLSPDSLRHQSFGEAVRSLTQTLDAGRDATYDLRIDDEAAALLGEEQVSHLLQIAREAVSNALRHGEATQVTVRLHRAEGEICLLVQDNGRGFAVTGSSGGGHGLGNMRARADRLGGRLQFSSSPGQGTRLIVTFAANSPA
jgi:signal transduction histidine kinase